MLLIHSYQPGKITYTAWTTCSGLRIKPIALDCCYLNVSKVITVQSHISVHSPVVLKEKPVEQLAVEIKYMTVNRLKAFDVDY